MNQLSSEDDEFGADPAELSAARALELQQMFYDQLSLAKVASLLGVSVEDVESAVPGGLQALTRMLHDTGPAS